jgi:hypothetical protein
VLKAEGKTKEYRLKRYLEHRINKDKYMNRNNFKIRTKGILN